ncbi:MAG TPA: SDR family oxidoreductase [Stellaceae bacterium]|nr:SDR family oxidoreductase [Stellaceae bacterium]
MQGKLCVITGASSGVGLAAAEALARKGARLALIARDPARGAAAMRRLQTMVPGVEIAMHYADLARLAEVRRVADELLQAYPRIDVLINNAGAMFRRREVSADGLERTFALNHMAYFLLTEKLRARLAASKPARIVSVASRAHEGATLDLDDLNMERRYDGWLAYRRSKLANILWTRELARRLAGSDVTANALHPGFVATRFGDNNRGWFGLTLGIAKRVAAIRPEEGAATVVHLASAPGLDSVSGGYFVKSAPALPSAAAQDDTTARRLWQASEKFAQL